MEGRNEVALQKDLLKQSYQELKKERFTYNDQQIKIDSMQFKPDKVSGQNQ